MSIGSDVDGAMSRAGSVARLYEDLTRDALGFARFGLSLTLRLALGCLLVQERKGAKKYPTLLHDAGLSPLELAVHEAEECADQLAYAVTRVEAMQKQQAYVASLEGAVGRLRLALAALADQAEGHGYYDDLGQRHPCPLDTEDARTVLAATANVRRGDNQCAS